MPTQVTYGQDWPIGSIIEMHEEQLEIISNLGSSGTVRTMDGKTQISHFYWEYMGEKAVLISTPKAAE